MTRQRVAVVAITMARSKKWGTPVMAVRMTPLTKWVLWGHVAMLTVVLVAVPAVVVTAVAVALG